MSRVYLADVGSLEKNSTIQVTNPIQQAVNSGLYEKLDDNDSD